MQTQEEKTSLGGRMPFLPPSAAGSFARCGVRGKCCRAAAGVCKRGYRTPLKTWFPIPPLATPPDLPVCRDSLRSRGYGAGDAIKTALSSGAHCRRLGMACLRRRAWFPRMTVRGRWCREGALLFSLDISSITMRGGRVRVRASPLFTLNTSLLNFFLLSKGFSLCINH